MNAKTKKLVIKELNRLARGGIPTDKAYGVCRQLSMIMGFPAYEWIELDSRGWKHNSGDCGNPVEGSYSYHRCKHAGTLWKGKQAKLRRSLCRHLLKQLTAKKKSK